MKNSFLNEEIALMASNAWVTRITAVNVTHRDSALVSISRPDGQIGVRYSGIIRVFDLNGEIINETPVPQTTPPTTTVSVEVKDSKLDFYSLEYTISYGPEDLDKRVDYMATRVQVSPDAIYDFQGSSCHLMTTTNSQVTARYSVPRSFRSFSGIKIFVVEGSVMIGGEAAIQGKYISLGDSSLPTDIVTLNYSPGTFVVGKDYTVCLYGNGYVRQWAGQSYKFS